MAAPLTATGPGFEAGLTDHIRAAEAAPFVAGKMDCSLWVADWVQRRTGVDLAEDFRGQYRGREEYLRLLIPMGGLVRVAARRLASIGAEVIDPAKAKPGDIGIVPTTDGPALAIRGDGTWLCKTTDRLEHAEAASFAWRLP